MKFVTLKRVLFHVYDFKILYITIASIMQIEIKIYDKKNV